MEVLKYSVIKTKTQYKRYCEVLEDLAECSPKSKATNDEIELLTLLIEKWDEAHSSFMEVDPIQLLHSFMNDHQLKAKDLAEILDVSKGYVSDILHYKKGLSKEVIRALSDYFKVTQEAFNRYYKLDDIGFIGTQEKRSATQIKLDAARTSRAVRRVKSSRTKIG